MINESESDSKRLLPSSWLDDATPLELRSRFSTDRQLPESKEKIKIKRKGILYNKINPLNTFKKKFLK
jgi:hypothetical protein